MRRTGSARWTNFSPGSASCAEWIAWSVTNPRSKAIFDEDSRTGAGDKSTLVIKEDGYLSVTFRREDQQKNVLLGAELREEIKRAFLIFALARKSFTEGRW
jgi:hypothetical protein